MSDADVQKMLRVLRERHGVDGLRFLVDAAASDVGRVLDVLDAIEMQNWRALEAGCRETPHTEGDLRAARARLAMALRARA